MAQRGRKPDTLAAKVSRGTVRPTPDVLAQMQAAPADVPVKDDQFNDLEAELWDANVEHFVAQGARAADSLLLADTVSMAAEIIQRRRLFMAGEDVDPPSVTSRVEMRTRLELFGMAGPKSRIGKMMSGPATSKVQPFANNGNRPRA